MAQIDQRPITLITGHGLKKGETMDISLNGQVVACAQDHPGHSLVVLPVFTFSVRNAQEEWDAVDALLQAQQQTQTNPQYRSTRGGGGNQ